MGPMAKSVYGLILNGIIELMLLLLGMVLSFRLCMITSLFRDDCWVLVCHIYNLLLHGSPKERGQ